MHVDATFSCLVNNIQIWSSRALFPFTRMSNCHLVVVEEYNTSMLDSRCPSTHPEIQIASPNPNIDQVKMIIIKK